MSGVPAHIYQKSIVRQKADGMGIEGKGVMVVEWGGGEMFVVFLFERKDS